MRNTKYLVKHTIKKNKKNFVNSMREDDGFDLGK